MVLPATAQAMRAAAERSQARRNMMGAAAVFTFVGSVFFYSMNAVSQGDGITERELAEFRADRARKQRIEQKEASGKK